jgi:hypothetical protein
MKIAHLSSFILFLLTIHAIYVFRPENQKIARASHFGLDKESKIQLTGKVTSIEKEQKNGDIIRIYIDVHLVLKNISEKNIIVYWNNNWLGEVRLSGNSKTNEKVMLCDDSAWPSTWPTEERKKLREGVNKISPPEGFFKVLTPSQEITKESRLFLDFKRDVGFSGYISLQKACDLTDLSLELTYEAWPTNIENRLDSNFPELGLSLRKKWEDFGVLQLEKLTTEPIVFSLTETLCN